MNRSSVHNGGATLDKVRAIVATESPRPPARRLRRGTPAVRFENAGIFNLNLPAMGGGEKRTLVLAEHLSRTMRVTLVTADLPDVSSLERFFGVDLQGIAVVPIGRDARDPERCARAVADL